MLNIVELATTDFVNWDMCWYLNFTNICSVQSLSLISVEFLNWNTNYILFALMFVQIWKENPFIIVFINIFSQIFSWNIEFGIFEPKTNTASKFGCLWNGNTFNQPTYDIPMILLCIEFREYFLMSIPSNGYNNNISTLQKGFL